MAEYYTQFAARFDCLTEENKKQCLGIAKILGVDVDVKLSAREELELMGIFPSEDGPKDDNVEEVEEAIEFSIEEDGATSLLLFNIDEGGSIDQVVYFVCTCAKHLNLTHRWGFEWANSSNKADPDGFGGGAVVVDLATGKTEFSYTTSWLLNKLKEPGKQEMTT